MEFLHNIYNLMLPECVIILFIFIQIILAMFLDIKFYKLAKWLTVLGIFLSIAACKFVHIAATGFGFKNSFVLDKFSLFFKILILAASFLIIFLTKKTVALRRKNAFQFNVLFLTTILGALFLVSSNDFLTMYISMETISIAMFFLLGFDNGYQSKEASYKYILTSAVSSAVFLFGVSYLYGLTGSINFNTIYNYFLNIEPTLIYPLSGIFIASGLAFKLGVVPFANWIIDIYEGANTSVVAFLSVVPKIAMFGILVRLLIFPLSNSYELYFTLIIISIVTAIWANSLAIRQKNIKKIMACSSSANAAYVLFAASLVSAYNLSTVIFYLVAYIFMNIGVFAAIVILESSDFANKLYEFKNIANSNPIFALCFSICILGLAGMPITVGFISKIYLFSAILRSGLFLLPFFVILLVSIVIAMFYYLSIIKFMFEKSETVKSEVIPHKVSSAIVILYFCAMITILLGIYPTKIIEVCLLISASI